MKKEWNAENKKELLIFLNEMKENLSYWGSCAMEYIQKKYGLQSDINEIDDMIKKVEEIST